MHMHKIRLVMLAIVIAAGVSACGDRSATDKAEGSLDHQLQTDKTGSATEDTAITAKIKTAILAEPTLSSIDIKVETVEGVATLDGQVDSQANVDAAGKVAATVSGVQRVNNRLTVKAPN